MSRKVIFAYWAGFGTMSFFDFAARGQTGYAIAQAVLVAATCVLALSNA